MSGPLVVVGDALLDRDVTGTAARLCPDAPAPVVESPVVRSRPGGAALAAALAAREGAEVVLVSAVGDDDAGASLRAALLDCGVELVAVGLDGQTPEKVRIRAGDRVLARVDHGGAPAPIAPLPGRALRAIGNAGAVLVSDYGRGMTSAPDARTALARLAPSIPVVWDPHPRGAAPVPGVRLATPNAAEVRAMAHACAEEGLAADVTNARMVARAWRAAGVAVTRGANGAVLVQDDNGPPFVAPAPVVARGDSCGAGDRFAAAAAWVLARGGLPTEAVVEAVTAASAFVADGAAGAFAVLGADRSTSTANCTRNVGGGDDDAVGLARRVRAAGGVVVTAGGCFDLLHGGHVALLESARRLGDCLIVCLNSDASVGALKGPGRPVVGEGERAAVLRALSCVDAVVVFDEPTPAAVLERLRPHVFAKGGDYAGASLPEADILAAWGGQAVVVPYIAGHSTTRRLEVLRGRA